MTLKTLVRPGVGLENKDHLFQLQGGVCETRSTPTLKGSQMYFTMTKDLKGSYLGF